ncbi:MAG TPA: hypothetical protein VN829_09715 [Dongiaceae bacterium]|nr:hypothetical protein [Dongiaceae bacterium]
MPRHILCQTAFARLLNIPTATAIGQESRQRRWRGAAITGQTA